MRSGFTLLELSIVLVIIGLIIGGVTVGSELIRQAELKAISSEITNYKTAWNTFKLKYTALPGDFAKATAYWPGKTSNGDGNHTISPETSGSGYWCSSCEKHWVWQHLALAGLIPGTFTGSGGTLVPGQNIPASTAISGVGYNIHTMQYFDFPKYHGQTFMWVGKQNDQNNTGPFLTGTELQTLDSKLDDGLPDNGMMLMASGCRETISSKEVYKVGDGTTQCMFFFLINH